MTGFSIGECVGFPIYLSLLSSVRGHVWFSRLSESNISAFAFVVVENAKYGQRWLFLP